jgi:MarR family transcriptional regulator for hemolysin
VSARRRFGRTLIQVARLWRRRADAALAACGLSEATALPLVMLADLGDGIRQGVLADRLGLEGPSLVRLLDTLQADGLLQRREDPADRRAKTLHLTAQGRAMAERIETVLAGVRAELLGSIPDRELEAAFSLLQMLARRLGEGEA